MEIISYLRLIILKIINTEGIILNKKNTSDASMIVTVMTKDYGKINAIVYGIRKSKKRDSISVNPMSQCTFEFKEKNGSYTLSDYELIKIYANIYKNIDKLQLSLYMLYLVNQVSEYNDTDDDSYELLHRFLQFINELDISNVEDNYIQYTILSILISVIKNAGIYSEEDIFINNKDIIKKYLFFKKTRSNIYIRGKIKEVLSKKDLYLLVNIFEKYINEYFNTNIDYRKILIGGMYG